MAWAPEGFFLGEAIVDFWWSKGFFQKGGKHPFERGNSKLREKHFSTEKLIEKYQISKFRW